MTSPEMITTVARRSGTVRDRGIREWNVAVGDWNEFRYNRRKFRTGLVSGPQSAILRTFPPVTVVTGEWHGGV